MESVISIYFSRTKECAKIPTKRKEDAGYDIYPCLSQSYIKIEPYQTMQVPTGIASACPSNYYFQLFERSSTGSKGIAQRCGVIDSGFRGEWIVILTNLNAVSLFIALPEEIDSLKKSFPDAIFYPTDKAICQAVLLPVPQTTVYEISYDELQEFSSDRMSKMFGSTN